MYTGGVRDGGLCVWFDVWCMFSCILGFGESEYLLWPLQAMYLGGETDPNAACSPVHIEKQKDIERRSVVSHGTFLVAGRAMCLLRLVLTCLGRLVPQHTAV
jgi:hypothetical protein